MARTAVPPVSQAAAQKAAKTCLMTSCPRSAPYRRGLNSLQLAVVADAAVCRPLQALDACTYANACPTEPGVSLKTRGDDWDSCRG